MTDGTEFDGPSLSPSKGTFHIQHPPLQAKKAGKTAAVEAVVGKLADLAPSPPEQEHYAAVEAVAKKLSDLGMHVDFVGKIHDSYEFLAYDPEDIKFTTGFWEHKYTLQGHQAVMAQTWEYEREVFPLLFPGWVKPGVPRPAVPLGEISASQSADYLEPADPPDLQLHSGGYSPAATHLNLPRTLVEFYCEQCTRVIPVGTYVGGTLRKADDGTWLFWPVHKKCLS